MSYDDEDEFAARSQALSVLEGGVMDEDEIFGEDDLDTAADIMNAMPTADQLAHKTAIRQKKWRDLREVAPFARINPVSVLHGTIGGQQQVFSGGPALQVCNWGGEDCETTPVTITIAPTQQIHIGNTETIDPVTTVGARPFAIIQFGTRGFLVKAFIDIGLGCQLTVGASMVTVQVGLDPIPGGSPPISMKLAGMLSFFPVVRTKPITRTVYSGAIPLVLPPGFNNTFAVPPFAKDVTLTLSPLVPAPGAQLEFLDSSGAVIYSELLPVGTSVAGPFPLSGDIVFVRLFAITNPILDSRLIFGLEF